MLEKTSVMYSAEHAKKIEKSSSTLAQRIDHATYYYSELCRNKNQALSEKSAINILAEMFYAIGYSSDGFRTNIFKIKAYAMAFIGSLHPILDNLAYFSYYSLGINLSHPMEEGAITIRSIKNRIQHTDVRLMVDEMLQNNSVKYIEAISNHSKHRTIISANTQFYVSPPDGPRLMFEPFEFKGVRYPEMPVIETLKEGGEAIINRSIDIAAKIAEKI